MRILHFFWASVLSLPVIAAQEPISLQENPVSVFLIIPAIVIVLLLVVLLVATFKRNLTAALVRFMSFKRIFTRVKEQPKTEAEKAEEGISREDFQDYVGRLDTIEKGMPSAAPGDSFKNFSFIAKDFFSKLVGANHAYTDEEIAAHLESKRKSLAEFSNKISQMKYSGYQPSKEEVVKLITDFKSIVSSHVRRQKGESLAAKASNNLLSKIIDEDKKIFESIKGYVEFLKKEDKKQQIQELLSNEQNILEANIKKAKAVYDDILKLYCQLSVDERKNVYPKLIQFYNNVNKMVFSSVYNQKSKDELAYFSKELSKMRDEPEGSAMLKRLVSIPSRFPKEKPAEAALPELKLPDISGAPKAPSSVTAVRKPSGVVEIKLRIPRMGLPKFRLRDRLRQIHLPKFKFPKHEAHKVPIKVKPVKAAPAVRKPWFTVPKFELPRFKSRKPSLALPKLNIPEVKKGKPSKVPVPQVQIVRRPSFISVIRSRLAALAKPRRVEVPKAEIIKPLKVGKPKLVKLPAAPKPEIVKPVAQKAEKPIVQLKPAVQPKPVMQPKPGLFSRLFAAHPKPAVPPVKLPVIVKPELSQPIKVKVGASVLPSFKSKRSEQEEQLQDLVKVKSVVKEKPAVRKMPRGLQDEEQELIDKINQLMAVGSEELFVVDRMQEIRNMLDKAEAELRAKNASAAEVTYECIKQLFMKLSESDKKEIYPELVSFYGRLKAALEARRSRIVIPVKANVDLASEEQELLSKLDQLKGSI